MDLSQYAELFLAESREHVSACNHLLLEWERAPASAEPVGGIFRAVHTVKGMAATMGYARVADLAHRMENLLDRLRKTKGAPGGDLLQLLFRATDLLERAIGLAVQGREQDLDVATLGLELDQAAKRAGAPAGRVGRPGRVRVSASVPQAAAEDSAGVGRLVTIVLRAEAPLKGGRALLVLRRAQGLGAVSHLSPPEQAFGAEDFDGRFTFRLETATPAANVERALASAGDVESVAVAESDTGTTARAVEGGAGAAGATAERSRHIRVDLRRLDALMDLIGELVTARGRLNQLAAERRDAAVDDVAIQVSRLTGELQSEIIQARMTPVWQVFDRYPRLVRDLAKQLDKQVALRVEGKEIELDRTILDELGDPLVHLLRNAVDHGIETPAERKRRGKPAEGEIVLGAVRERASVAISIADDGRGLDRRRILEKAKREGLVDASVDSLTDDQLLRVIARPGFSTTEAVTSVSGRGVGLDVAMSKIRALGGTIEVQSEPGRGTTFVLRLPVTLAIVRALIADVGGERYALPLTYVSETVEFGAVPSTTVEGREAMVLRERVVPLVHLRELLSASGGPPSARRPVVVLQMGERRTGIVVDGMLGQQEIVVKGFDAPQGMLPVFSGATIMGDGVPALILDAGGLV
ncbi:MAG TPA: chemotaxis protein CheA [Gemmatimonadales bacterium]|nr:chemotaxis protein CheA [Gemmatimonadales bacterium]